MNSLIRKIYAFRIFEDLIFLYPLYIIFFADKGLSTFQISTLFMVWSVTSIVAEVPSGVLADKYSRKKLLAIGQLTRAIGYLVWLLLPTYEGFMIGFILWGLEGALTSGTYEALVFDELKAAGEEESYVKVTGRAESLGLVAQVVAMVSAAGAVLLGYNALILLSIVPVVLAAAVALSLPERKRIERAGDTRYFAMLAGGVRQALRTPALLKIILLGGFITCIYGTLEEYVPLFVRDTGGVTPIIPIIDALTVVAAALASFMAFRYAKLQNAAFMLVLAVSGALLAFAASVSGISAWWLLIAYTYLIKLLEVIFNSKLQHAIEEGTLRATVTSVNAFIGEVMAIGLYLLFGVLATYVGNLGAFRWIGGGIVAVALLYLLLAPRLLRRSTLSPA